MGNEAESLPLLSSRPVRARRTKQVTADDVMVFLRERYSAPEYAFMGQVRNATGYQRTVRTADGIAMSLWPSRGLGLYGFEVKVSRSDWLAEMHDPAKAEEIQQFCDGWWLVCGHEDIVQAGELPATWGLLVVRGRKLVAVKEAPLLVSKPLGRAQLAAIFRAAQQWIPPTPSLDEAMEEEIQNRVDDAKAKFDAGARHDRAVAAIEEFKKHTGIDLMEAERQYEIGPIADAVKFVRDSQALGYGHVGRLIDLARHAEKSGGELREYLTGAGLWKASDAE